MEFETQTPWKQTLISIGKINHLSSKNLKIFNSLSVIIEREFFLENGMKKSKQNERFALEKKGYNKEDVERFIVEENARNEKIHCEQRERIDTLVEENLALKELVKEYKSKEDKIAEAIIAKITAIAIKPTAIVISDLIAFSKRFTL